MGMDWLLGMGQWKELKWVLSQDDIVQCIYTLQMASIEHGHLRIAFDFAKSVGFGLVASALKCANICP